MGLAVNEGKTKYMLAISKNMRRIGFLITTEFVYLGLVVTSKNDIGLEIRHSVTLSTAATMVSISNWVAETSLVRQN